MKNLFLFLSVFNLLYGCTTQLNQQKKIDLYKQYISENQLENLDKIPLFKFHGWYSLGSQYLMISTSPKKNYLIQLKSHCFDLKSAYGIAIQHSSSGTLYSRFDAIYTPKFPQHKCYIQSIYQLNREQVDAVKKLGKS